MSQPCPRCAASREAIAQLGYSTFCSHCGGLGKVRDNGEPFITIEELADLSTEDLEKLASSLFERLNLVQSALELRYDEVDSGRSSA